jgi:hypothetical protein
MAFQPDWKTDAATQELVRIYQVAKKSIINDLTGIDVSAYKETEVMKAMKSITGILAELNRGAQKWTALQIPKSYNHGGLHARIRLEILGFRSSSRYDRQRHDRAMTEFKDLILKDLDRANATIKRTADTIIHLARTTSLAIAQIPETAPIQAFDDPEYLADVFKNWADKAVTEGYSRTWLSKMIKGRLIDNLEGGQFIVVNGRHFTLNYYAELVARTRLRESQTEATKNMSQEYDCDLVQMSRHSNPCSEICKPVEGNIYSLSGTDPDYPVLTAEDEPPLHPNCEHSIAPTSRTAIAVQERWQ